VDGPPPWLVALFLAVVIVVGLELLIFAIAITRS
jgi:hypothetical protein